MRLLFRLDAKDYDCNGTAFVRPSVRGIIIRNGKVGMIHSLKYNYYKFPGGGIEAGENHRQALTREVREETGLSVLSDAIKEYGFVHRIQKGGEEAVFIQDNYYYLCQTAAEIVPQVLDDYEAAERFTLEFISPETATSTNRNNHSVKDQVMLKRKARVLELLIQEGYFSEQ